MIHKVISLYQPWASLVATGAKTIETRSFDTKHRGQLLIHASVKFNHALHTIALEAPFFGILRAKGYKFYGYPGGRNSCSDTMPRGAIIGSVNLLDTIQFGSEKSKAHMATFEKDSLLQERAFGDYTEGRWGWILSEPVLFDTPIPAKGNLGIWKWEGEIPS